MREYIFERPDEAESTAKRDANYRGELVRCKDCKYRKPKKTTNLNSHCIRHNRAVMADDYCSKAKRKEE